jgi:hypothetical protein
MDMHQHTFAEFTPQEGRKFGVTVGLAFVALAGLLLWRDKETTSIVFAVIGGLLFLAGLMMPAQLGPIYRGWMKFAIALSKITTPIIMGIIYFGLFLVTGLLRRSMGKNQMIRSEKDGTYWITRDYTRANLERQF